jgi:hypothetical protein
MRGRLGLVADGEPVELDGSVVGPASFAVAGALPAADQVACEIADHRQVGHGATPSALGRPRRELPPLETANNELSTAEQPTSRR